MAHLSIEELMARFQVARQAGELARPSDEQLRLHRELANDCPAFTPNLLMLAWLLQRRLWTEREDARGAEMAFTDIQRVLERAVAGSSRGAPALVELGAFLDTYREAPHEAARLYEEAADKALGTVKDAWRGLLRYWNAERTKETLEKALQLGEVAERLFPEAPDLLEEITTTRRYAEQEGLLTPGRT